MTTYAADGSLNVTVVTGSTYTGLYAPDGSLCVTNTGMPQKNQGQPVTVVSGTLFGPPPTGFYYPWIYF